MHSHRAEHAPSQHRTSRPALHADADEPLMSAPRPGFIQKLTRVISDIFPDPESDRFLPPSSASPESYPVGSDDPTYLVSWIQQHGIDPSAPTENGDISHRLAAHNEVRSLERWYAMGGNPMNTDTHGSYAGHIALGSYEHPEAGFHAWAKAYDRHVQSQKGSHVPCALDLKNRDGQHAGHLAARHMNPEIFAAWLKKGHINARDNKDRHVGHECLHLRGGEFLEPWIAAGGNVWAGSSMNRDELFEKIARITSSSPRVIVMQASIAMYRRLHVSSEQMKDLMHTDDGHDMAESIRRSMPENSEIRHSWSELMKQSLK
jgi:hypothetical protein